MSRKTPHVLVLDIDFTLIHLEYVPESIEVPGRTRPAWLAPQTVEELRQLQPRYEIILATARSWDGTRWVTEGLAQRGVKVSRVVIEDGARLGEVGDLRAFEPSFDARNVRQSLVASAGWPAIEWQLDFENCAVARCETTDDALRLAGLLPSHPGLSAFDNRLYRDGRKLYILPREADKWSALRRLLGEDAALAAGVGDGANDLVWLPKVAHPATFSDAGAALIAAVRARGGIIGGAGGHEGICELLRALGDK